MSTWWIHCCVLYLLLGLSAGKEKYDDISISQRDVDPCVTHGVLDQEWRSENNAKSTDKNGTTHCDQADRSDINFPGWFRFKGNAGNRMPEKCPASEDKCGTSAPMWLNGKHPAIGDGVVSRQACAYYSGGCCHWSSTVKVKMCPTGFYVYYLPNTPVCSLAYCGEYHDLCLDNNGGCSHYCSMDNSTFSAVCSCPKGFRLGKDQRTCEYHDLCLENNGGCSDNCSMDNSTFTVVCSCPGGFLLGSNNHTCVKDECTVDNGGCSHICVHREYNDHRHCQCPVKGLVLEQDGRTCQSPDVTVTCTDQHLQLDLLRSAFHGLNESQLQLADPSCQGTGNRTFITFKSPLHGCGTSMNFTNSSLVYSNIVSTRPNYLSLMSGVVTWAGTVEVPFECEYARDHWIAHSFKPVVEKLSFKEKGRGNLTFNIQQFQSEKFATAFSKKDYPVSVNIRDHMYFVLSVNTKSKDVKLFADACKATPSSSPFDFLQFNFIINGCPVTSEVKFLPSQDPREIRLSIQAFQFLKSFPQIYLHCKLVVCHTADMTSRCTKGCVQDDSPGKRRAETVDDFQISEGPFHYIVY
ncbi:oncoprotein-induced transcript 3 protein [Lingula anatina]|uniref:Oncoprotein-induced transcript 3 protein n=1 Tax=Lingula anatina TaxID=7574 RepID=A0A1S3KC77_LINAN|nr:oncoprotein-induced transcript 3 protein [Lingula anatina]|eukprot:XP_013419861.1 oncoprotein-induced transcript 3 protein [Lingula anatina]